MATKYLKNDYRLENGERHLSPDEIKDAMAHFEYFMGNFQQIVDKNRQLVPFSLNAFQRKLFETILPMVHKDTRIDRRRNILVVKSRQVGASVGVVALINYLCAFADLQNLSVGHVFPVGDTIAKFYQQKVTPIITGIHPDLFPNMDKTSLSSSIITRYNDVKGIPLNNYYELISSGSSSIRSSTINILLEDEVCYYSHPEQLESAILPALPDYGFSLLVYLSTVGEDASSMFFLDKLRIAIDNPEDWTVIFVPWFHTYPERSSGINFESLILDEYESEVLVPAFERDELQEERWGDCIDWYRRRLREHNNNRKKMQLEYPSTLEEVLSIGRNRSVWEEETLNKHEKNIQRGTPYRILMDSSSRSLEMKATDDSPFIIFKRPIPGHRYRIAIDPITAHSDDSDFCVMQVMDLSNNEQVAVFSDKNLQDEDYADWAVNIATLYNKAELCPEINVAGAFIVAVNARRYYHWYYANAKNRAERIPGIRTTVATKEMMIDRLTTLLDRESIIIHKKYTLDEFRTMEKKVKVSSNGSRSLRMAAKRGKHDDEVMSLAIYAASLDTRQLEGRKNSGWAIL